MNKKRNFGINVGGISVIVVLVVLSLTALSVLSILTAEADLKLTNKTKIGIEKFYEAENKGEDFIGEMHTLLQEAAQQVDTIENYKIKVKDKIAPIREVQLQEDNKGQLILEKEILIQDSQVLAITLVLSHYEVGIEPGLQVIGWQVKDNEIRNYGEQEIEFNDAF